MTTKEKIEELLYLNADDFELAKVLKADIKAYFETLDESFATSGGKDFLVKHTKKIDAILKLIYRIAMRGMFKQYQPMKNALPLTIAALGSYGREQLCVHSDIDLLIVYKEIPGYNVKETIEKILYLIWDSGLKLGHRVHPVDELLDISRTDITIKTALIESRYVEGSHSLWTETQNVLDAIRHDNPETFIRQKLQEHDLMHQKFPLSMEPNLKEGEGGFRDANLVYWIGKIRYNIDRISDLPNTIIDETEYREFRMALEFLFRVRSALHLVAGKKEDRLRLYLIPEVACHLGYEQDRSSHMKFAKRVITNLRTIQLYSTIWLDLLCKEYDIKKEGLLSPVIKKESKSLLTILKVLNHEAKSEYRASPALLQQLLRASRPERIGQEYYPVIRKIFQQNHAHSILATLYDAHLLYLVIPALKKVIDLPQFDGYHEFPVGVHLLHCLYWLEHIQDESIRTLYEALDPQEKEMLKLATFLHDAGKGRKRDHSLVGASLFKFFARQLGYEEAMIQNGITLIHYHTLMSNIAQREDLYNEKTILKFASRFKTKKMLDMIYILTYADMNGVSSKIYNTFTARLLQALYTQSIKTLEHGEMLNMTAKRVKKEESLKRSKLFTALPRTTQNKILSIPSNLMFLRYRPEKIIQVATEALRIDHYTYTVSNRHFLTIEVIRKGDFNLGYLLGKLSHLNLINMDICKLSNDLKYFQFDFSEAAEEDEVSLIKSFTEEAFEPERSLTLPVPVIKEEELTIDCNYSRSYARMELHTKDQKGLIAYIMTLFDELNIDIASAKIHTQKNRVRDLFLIEKNGNFCHNVDKIVKKMGTES
ncbi:MAG: HD domain-containing protein [Campylobacterota bacterium]|nr:HD domain-containing protein [Campylobacterota bacterium]